MKKFVFAVRAALLLLILSSSGYALADKKCTDPTAQCVDTIHVGGGGGGDGGGIGWSGGGGGWSGGGNGGCTGNCSGGNNGSGSTPTYKQDTLKTDRRFCIRSNETCDGWFLSATTRCGTFFSGISAYNCMTDAEGQRSDSCSSLRAANTCW